MWNWFRSRPPRRPTPPTCQPRLEHLEERDVPAITIRIDYTYDTGFFANNPEARAAIEQVAAELGNSISADLAAITPGGGNSWAAVFTNPATGAQTQLANLTVAADTITVFVGARTLAGSTIGLSTSDGYRVSGSTAWMNAVTTRGWSGFAPWGGSISFDSSVRWHYGLTTSGLDANELDFYSVALHEMGHVLGLGTSSQWTALARVGYFYGASADALYGAPVPLASDGDHWADGVTLAGQSVSLDPTLASGKRVTFSSLDAAALRDIGWGAAEAAATTPFTLTGLADGQEPVAFTGSLHGSVAVYTRTGGALTDTGQQLTPFSGYGGTIRVAGGDFDGDGITDFAFTVGAGPQAVVEIVSGRDGSMIVNQTIIFQGFKGGLFVAAADIDGDGKAELVVSADAGAGPHIQTFRVANGTLQLQSSFFAFDNPAFTGGARVAAGDIDRDGYADVVVTTGGGALGRVAVYSGAALRNGTATRLLPDFIAFDGLWSGLNAAVGDMDGDGYAELAVSPDRGAPAHVKVWSGASLTANRNTQPSALPLAASFFALPTSDSSGARLALRDTDGDGRADLVVASGNQRNAVARAFTYEQMRDAPAGVPTVAPLGSLLAFDGLYVG